MKYKKTVSKNGISTLVTNFSTLKSAKNADSTNTLWKITVKLWKTKLIPQLRTSFNSSIPCAAKALSEQSARAPL